MSRGGTTAYYSADRLGSVTSLEDRAGSAVAAYTYDSFGKLTSPEPALMNPFRCTGREWDQETNLYYYRARYYDPGIGRFMDEDPLGFGGGINFYAYVGNSPISNIDPSGLARCMYVINGGQNGGGWFNCTPDNPKNKSVSFAAASGNNGDSQHHCKITLTAHQ